MRVEVVPGSPISRARASAGAAEKSESPRPLAAEVAARWREYLGRVGAGAVVTRNLDRLAKGAACVVTGQQAGVLTGPLLTILKAARAVSLARELETASGTPVIPVFWIAADDHDLDEIHHTVVVGASGEVRKLRLELGGARGAAGEIAAPADAARLVKELWELAGIDAAALSPEPFLPREGDSLSTWFARCLLQFLGEEGLVPFEPALLGAAARPIFEAALRDDGAIARALREGADALRARGLEPPLPVEEDPPLFWIERGARTHVRRRGRDLVVGERVVARDELLAHCGPELPRLSANVALRPVLQAGCLPALAYVCGPHEIVYYEQLRPLHALFRVPFPRLEPRPQATILSIAAARALRKLEVAPRELLAARDRRDGAKAEKPPLIARGESLRAEVARYVDELLASSPSVKSAAARRAAQLLQSFDGLLERAGSANAELAQRGEVRWTTLENLVRPRGKPQDRELNFLPFFAEHGRGLVDALLKLRGELAEEEVVRRSPDAAAEPPGSAHSVIVPD
jgi:bacillithiol biosynthesis cysteine-adding enzyme BshC